VAVAQDYGASVAYRLWPPVAIGASLIVGWLERFLDDHRERRTTTTRGRCVVGCDWRSQGRLRRPDL